MKFKELSEYLQANIKRSCKLNKELNDYIPSENDIIIAIPGKRTGVLKIETIFSDKLKVNFNNNNIISIDKLN